MADADRTLQILVQLGVVNAKDVTAVKDLLGETKDAAGKLTESMPENLAAWEKYDKHMMGAGESAEGFSLKGKDMRKVLYELNQVLPGSTEAFKGFQEVLAGGVPVLAVVLLAIEAVKGMYEMMTESSRIWDERLKESFAKTKEASRAAVAEFTEFQNALEKARKPSDEEAADLARKRAINEEQFKGKRELLALDKEAELNAAKSPEEKAAVVKKYAGKEAALDSAKEAADIQLLEQTKEKLRSGLAKLKETAEELEASQASWHKIMAWQQANNIPAANSIKNLEEDSAKLKEVRTQIVEKEGKLANYSSEAETGGAVHGIRDTVRLASENRIISKAAMEGIDPALNGAVLTDEQREANQNITSLFSQYRGGLKALTDITKNHIEHSTSQQAEINALKTALAELQRRSGESHR